MTNPIILKELIQSAHRRRTFLVRVALPLVAMGILAPQLIAVIAMSGQDWRALSNVARPMFNTWAWMQLIVFMILASSEARNCLQKEWTSRTMEILCATPLSVNGILFGKFLAVLGKVFFAGLALLPIVGIWFRFGRIPPNVVVGSLGVMLGSTILFAGLGLAEGAMAKPKQRLRTSGLTLSVVYLIIISLLGAWLGGKPGWVAAVPLWSFHHVMSGSSPGTLSPNTFAMLATAMPLGIGLLALVTSFWLFRKNYHRQTGGGKAKKRRRIWLRSSRSPMKSSENPFYWQEMGHSTIALRWGAWIVFGIVSVTISMVVMLGGVPLDDAFSDVLFLVIAIAGAAWVTLASGLYSVSVFAREKAGKTAAALVLTGCDARTVYKGKIRAIYVSLRYSFLLVLIATIAYTFVSRGSMAERMSIVIAILTYAAVGPAVAALVGMVFSASARSPGGALAGIILSPLFSWAISAVLSLPALFFGGMLMALTGGVFTSIVMLVTAAIVIWIFLRCGKTWPVWRLSLFLAMTSIVSSGIMAALLALLDYIRLDKSPAAVFLASVPLYVAMGAFWYWLGARIFEQSMLREV